MLLREEMGGLLVRLQGVAMLTHLQRSCSLLHPCAPNRRSAVHRVAGSSVARRVCTSRTPRLALSARRVGLVHPLSTRCTHWDWRYAQLPPSRGQETKSVWVLRTKVLSIRTFGYLPNTEHRGAMRDKRQIAAKQKGFGC